MASFTSRRASFVRASWRRSQSFLPCASGNFAFGEAVSKIDSDGNQGGALGFYFIYKLPYLFFVHQKLPSAKRSMVPWAPSPIFGDVAIFQPQFAAPNMRVGLADVGFALAQRLYFGAAERHTGFVSLQQVVIVRGGAVLRDE